MYTHDSWLMMTHGHPSNRQALRHSLFIHRKGQRTAEEVATMAELMHGGNIDEVAMVTGGAVCCQASQVR